MLRLGQSAVSITRYAAAVARNDALLTSPVRQQHGISMLSAMGGSEHLRVNSSEHPRGSRTGGSSSAQQRNRSTTICSNLHASRGDLAFAASAGRLALPRRLMSTAAGGGSNPPTGNTGPAAPAVGDVDPDALAGTADAAMAAASTADQAQAVMEVAPETFKLALYTPPNLAIMAVDGVHATTGMPYWMTIVAITLGIRTAILPIGLLAARNGARTAAMKPEMDALQAAIKDDQQSSQSRRAERYRQETKALFKKYGASLMMNAALPLVQLPLFIGFFLGLRRMPEANPEFATGGTLWFQDLGAADPYMVFPVMTGVMMMAIAELGGEAGAMAVSSTKMKAGMRGMALLVTPLTMHISTGVFLYWTTSNFYSILQTMMFKSPSVKKFFNFPSPTLARKSSTAEKEMDWFDVLGGGNPIKEYKRMQQQREAQAWFVHGDERTGPTRADGEIAREGAPFHAPPSISGPEGETKPAATGQSEPPQSKPRVVLSDVRPKSAPRRRRKNMG